MTMNKLKAHMATHDLWLPPMQQLLFRDLLHVFSYPGQVRANHAAEPMTWLALLAALCDGEVGLADPHGMIPAEQWPMLEAVPGTPEQAAFIVADGGRALDFEPRLGSLESPETGATLLLRVAALGEARAGAVQLSLSGPGVRDRTGLAVTGLDPSWLKARAEWVAAFPLGVDLLLCDDCRFAALPRTTQVQQRDVLWVM
jgi:alpha-D-ribose 1-methylphosphonate 5-triphosphate synthase subunit PhnH